MYFATLLKIFVWSAQIWQLARTLYKSPCNTGPVCDLSKMGMQNKKKQLVPVSDKDAYATKMKGNRYFALFTSTITEKEMEKESVCCDPVTANVAED